MWGNIAIDCEFKDSTVFAEENADCKFAVCMYIDKIHNNFYEDNTDEVTANLASIGLKLTPLTSEESIAYFHTKNPNNFYKAEFTRAQLETLSENVFGYAVYVYGRTKA